MSQTSTPTHSIQSHLSELIPSQGWIIGPRQDFILFLGTPILLLTLFGLASHFWSLSAFIVFATVLAMGHYLPGFLRAYGDPVLFRRFRARFLLAPIVLISLSIYMSHQEASHAFMLLVVVWGAWHWLMQTYGLVRIYDAKARNFDAASARLDYALCIAWFGILYWRTDGAATVLMRFYMSGGIMSPKALDWIASIWVVATLVISAVYVTHTIRRTREGNPPSMLKLALLGVSFAFYLYAFGYSSSHLIAYSLFEGYHDIQYLAIVWVFNCNRASKDPNAGSFTRFLFRHRTPLVVLYVLMCVGFGSYDYFVRTLVTEKQLADTALGLIVGLALVHFYFDGFIWRIRETETRTTLDVAAGEPSSKASRLPTYLRHGLLWLAIGAPLLALNYREGNGKGVDDITAFKRWLEVRPDSYKANMMLATELKELGRTDEAFQYAERACQLRPGYDQCDVLYADLQMTRPDELTTEQLDDVIDRYERAAVTRSDMVPLQLKWANALRLRGRTGEAAEHFQAAIDLDPNNPETFYQLAKLLMIQGKTQAAELACREALRADPNHALANATLGQLQMESNPRTAITYFRRAIQSDPTQARVMAYLAVGLATVGDPALRDVDEALRVATEATKADQNDAEAWNALAVVNAARADFNAAINAGEKAMQLCRDDGEEAAAQQIEEALQRYRQGQP